MPGIRLKIRWFTAGTFFIVIILGVLKSPLQPLSLLLFLLPVWTFLAFALVIAPVRLDREPESVSGVRA